MNDISIENPELELVAAGRKANDLLRRSMEGGNLILTAGILALGGEIQARILDAVRSLKDFDCSDPLDDHSIGDVKVTVTLPGAEPSTLIVFFKLTRPGHDGKAALTLSLADEWWACRDAIDPHFREGTRDE